MPTLTTEANEHSDRCSGPRVAWAFQKLLSLIFLIAWLSIGAQIQLLIGSRGLLPFAPLREQLLERGIGFSRFPSLLLYAPNDSYRQGTPAYVFNLLQRLCRDPEAVESLFTTRLPRNPEAVRLAFYKYTFTNFEEWRQSGAWWKHELIEQPKTLSCERRGVQGAILGISMSSTLVRKAH